MRNLFRPYNIVFLVVLLIVSLLWNEGRRAEEGLHEANGEAMRTMEVLSSSQELLVTLADIETGARGYVITRNDAYLEPYRNGLARLPQRMHRLRELLGDRPEYASWLVQVDETARARAAHAQGVVAVLQAGRFEDAQARVRNGSGKQAMDQLRALIAQLETAERQKLYAGNRKVTEEVDRVRRNTLIGGILALLLMLEMMIAINAMLDARRRTIELARSGEARERDQRDFLRTIVDTDDNLIFVLDAEGRFAFCNVAFADLMGLDPSGVQGRYPRDIDPKGLLVPLLESGHGLEVGEEWRFDRMLFLDSKGGERWFQLLKRPFELSDGRQLLLTVGVDVSSHLRVERLKDEFVSTVSHELRTPLTSIRGALDMVNSGMVGELPNGARQLLGIAHKNTGRLVRLINDLLDVQKLESGQLRMQRAPHRIRPLLGQAIDQNMPYAREFDVRLVLAPGGDGIANVDPDRFAQMMANLLSNAVKYSRKGEAVDIALEDDGPDLVISVTDHGSGIPEHFRSRVFQRFAQADSAGALARGGTGLGLAITNSLVTQMGGQIGFDTAEGTGTCFHVRFPKLDPGSFEDVQPVAVAAPAAAPAAVPRILHVEDDIDMRQVIRRKLESDGLRVDGAGTLAGARALLALGHFDLVVLDLILPDGDGSELLPDLDARVPPIPVIVFSAKDALAAERSVIEHVVKSRQHEDHLARMVLDSLQHVRTPREDPDD